MYVYSKRGMNFKFRQQQMSLVNMKNIMQTIRLVATKAKRF